MTDAEGCKTAIRRDLFSLIPAHAGVILRALGSHLLPAAYPRARGGDPGRLASGLNTIGLSPRTRG